MSVRAKFKITSKTETESGFEIKASPVTGGSEENERFFKFTPYGELSMGVVSADVAVMLPVGKAFYLDFVPAE